MLQVFEKMKLRDLIFRIWFPIALFGSEKNDYFTNHSVASSRAKETHRELCEYLLQFFTILQTHMESEFEVQIRDGAITTEGRKTLRKLSKEFDLFQYEGHIHRIVNAYTALFEGQPLQEGVIEQIRNINAAVLVEIDANILKIQKESLDNRRSITNRLCKEKISSGPVLHNLTSVKIPKHIQDILRAGLHVVPKNQHDLASVKKTIIGDLKNAAISYFRTSMGYFPPCAYEQTTLQQTLRHLMVLTPSGSQHLEFYDKMEELYSSDISAFIDSLNIDDSVLKPSELVKKHLPKNVIITVTDKNLGVALVPIEWFKLTYESQCTKGGYTQVFMNEQECISMLLKKISTFRSSCNSEQRIILKSVWPRRKPKLYKIAVLKVVPKIHKLATIDANSWKHLPSRPIRGGENCPINPPSKALCTLLQDMLKDLRINFPVLSGMGHMWAKFAHGIPPGFPDFIFCLIFCSVFVSGPGIFVPLDSRSAARSKLVLLFWDFFWGNIDGTVHRSINL